jgi:hypothetical protein
MKHTMKKLWHWLKQNIFVKEMFLYIVVAAIIFYIPLWLFVFYAYSTGNNYLYGLGIAYVMFWAGPFTPTIPAIFAIAIFLKQLMKKLNGKRRDDDETIS